METGFDYRNLKSKIRHFLLQQDPNYIESICSNSPAPAIVTIAKTLDQQCPIGVRRLQKYLSGGDNAKDLSITLEDLQAFAALAGKNISSFVAYLFSEEVDCQLTKWQSTMVAFFERVHLGLRRELTYSIFSCTDQNRNEELLEMLLKIAQLKPEELHVLKRVLDALHKTQRL